MIEITTSVLFLISSLYGGFVSASNDAGPLIKADSIQKQGYEQTVKADSPITFEQYVRKYFKDDPILAEIAMCESSFRQYDSDGAVLTGRVNKSDVGVMQINKYYHLERAEKFGFDLDTIEGNMAFAKKLYRSEGTKPWNSSSKCWGKFAKLQNKISDEIES
jgi:hypothetical protein